MKIALLGNPNSGKTTLFNSLTGSTAHVGNWPGVTVEKRSGYYIENKKNIDKTNPHNLYRKKDIEIIDLPGIYSLSPYTPEEVIARNYILEEKPDCIINVVDATNLERNLYMTTQILEIDVPVVIALNMIDVLEKNNDAIDTKVLEKALGVPVVSVSALREKGLNNLVDIAKKAVRKGRKPYSVINYTEEFEVGKKLYDEKDVDSPLFHITKALEKDDIELKEHQEIVSSLYNKFKDSGIDYESNIAEQRYNFIEEKCCPAIKNRLEREEEKLTLSDRIDKVLTNKWAGIPIFLALLFVIFHITFSSDLFYMGALGANFGEGYKDPWWIIDGAGVFDGLFYSEDGVLGLGEFLHTFVESLNNGIMLTVESAMESSLPANAQWFTGFIVNGVLSGLFAVFGFLPQILLLFFFLGVLEESGYMARVAFIFDRIFRNFGLSGRAILPMIMGFGCSVPAMTNTRTLATDKEKIKTIRVIPFFTCGAKMNILVAVVAALTRCFGVGNTDLITFGFYLGGIAVAIMTVIIMNKTTLREDVPPFIMELPAYHMPQIRGLLNNTWQKTKAFIKKAFTIILVASILIWITSHIAWNWTYLEDKQISDSILASIGMFIQPILTPMGFGSQLGNNGWVFGVAAIQGLVAKENAVVTLNVIGSSLGELITQDEEGINALSSMVKSTGISVGGLLGFTTFNMLTLPCFAAVATAKAELGKKAYIGTIWFWLLTGYVGGTAMYLMADWTWTIAIFVPLIILIFVALYFYDKYKTKLEIEAKKRAKIDKERALENK